MEEEEETIFIPEYLIIADMIKKGESVEDFELSCLNFVIPTVS